MSRGVARGEQAANIQSANFDLITLTHLVLYQVIIHPLRFDILKFKIYLLCDSLNPIITTKDNQSWHLQKL